MKNSISIIKWFAQKARRHLLQATLNAVIGVSSVALDFAFIWATKRCIDIATGHSDQSLRVASAFLIGITLILAPLDWCNTWSEGSKHNAAKSFPTSSTHRMEWT